MDKPINKTPDKLKISLISGLFASIAKDLLTAIGDLFFHFHPSYWNYSHYLLFQKVIRKFEINFIPSILIEIFFGINVSIIYIYFIRKIIQTKFNYLLGFIFGLNIWFIIRGLITIFKIEELGPSNIGAIFYNWGIAIIYGLILEWMIKKMDK